MAITRHTWWSDEALAEVLAQARASRARAATMRRHCQQLQEMMLEQQERLRAVMARVGGPAELPLQGGGADNL